jgi:hypothetical protein
VFTTTRTGRSTPTIDAARQPQKRSDTISAAAHWPSMRLVVGRPQILLMISPARMQRAHGKDRVRIDMKDSQPSIAR